jgi:hypothetical protein
MDLASGYSDSINYGNGYTPLANNAINNNNAEYWRNQAATALMAQNAQNNVFASGGGFGQQTADYAGAGAAYGRAVGGGGNIYAAQVPGMEYFYQEQKKLGEGGIGSDAGQSPNQPAMPYQPYGPGYFDNTFGSVANTGGTSSYPYKGNPYYMPDPMPAQQPIQPGGGFGEPGFGPYGGSSYTGQPGYGLGIGSGNPLPQVPGMEYFYREMYGGGSPFQNTGMSMQERPDDRQLQELASGQRYRDATNTSPAIDPTQGYANLNPDTTPGWGYKPYNYPTAPAYEAPRTSFGSDQYPLIMYDKGEAGSNLLDPNMLNRTQDTWTNRS